METGNNDFQITTFKLFKPDDISDVCSYVESVVRGLGRTDILPLILTGVIELVMNGFKAYDKREFFNKNKLSFQTDYKSGMEKFVKSFQEDQDANAVILREFPVLTHLKLSRTSLVLEVETILEMHQEEKEAVLSKMKTVGIEDDPIEAEGGGIGITMILSMVDNLKLDRKCFSFESNVNGTLFSISIPL